MYEFNNVFDVTYDTYTVNEAYREANNPDGSSTQTPVRNRAAAVIQELLTGDIAAVRRSAGDAGTAVFTIQIFTDAIETIAEKLIRMFEMAKKALFPDDSEGQIEDWKSFLRKLAEEINQIADGTEYNFIKPFAESGKTFSIPIGNGSKIDVFA